MALQSAGFLVSDGRTRFEEGKRLYGPGLQAGYQYTAASGFTVMISGGLGVALDKDEGVSGSAVQPILNLGVGYTWR